MKPARPVCLVYCINAELLESARSIIKGCDDVGCLTDDLWRSFFEQKETEAATTVMEEELSMIV